MAKRRELSPEDEGYEQALERGAKGLYQYFRDFKQPGPSPIDYLDEIKERLHRSGLAVIAFGDWRKPVSKIHKFDIPKIIDFVDYYRTLFEEEDYLEAERLGKEGNRKTEDLRVVDWAGLD